MCKKSMAMEAMVSQQNWFGYNSKDVLFGGGWSYGIDLEIQQEEKVSFQHFPDNQTSDTNNFHGDLVSSYVQTSMVPPAPHFNGPSDSSSAPARPNRRRSRAPKNKEKIENQRMAHIATERNRRKQMNQYLSHIRSLMPESYIQRGDQASIVGGAINFVKELEQRLQWLSAEKEAKEGLKFTEFFTFPQYSTSTSPSTRVDNVKSISMNESTVENIPQPTVVDVEVNVIERHANLKIRSKRRPSLLLKLVSGLNTMRLTILHLNVTRSHQTVLYSLSLQVEDDCKVTTTDEIASAVNQLLCRIQDDAMLNSTR